MAKELSVIIPTYNERANISILIERLSVTLKKIDFEIIVVDDDSEDKTWEEVEKFQMRDSRVRVLRRIGRKGLSSAVIEGVLLSNAKFITVIDGDLQHDENILPQMFEIAQQGADVVVGSRYLTDGSGGVGNWNKRRIFISRMATWLIRLTTRQNLSDPLSGFFLMRKQVFLDCIKQLFGQGFKILLDVLSNYEPGVLKVKEFPYTFKARQFGESKLSITVIIQLLKFFCFKTFSSRHHKGELGG